MKNEYLGFKKRRNVDVSSTAYTLYTTVQGISPYKVRTTATISVLFIIVLSSISSLHQTIFGHYITSLLLTIPMLVLFIIFYYKQFKWFIRSPFDRHQIMIFVVLWGFTIVTKLIFAMFIPTSTNPSVDSLHNMGMPFLPSSMIQTIGEDLFILAMFLIALQLVDRSTIEWKKKVSISIVIASLLFGFAHVGTYDYLTQSLLGIGLPKIFTFLMVLMTKNIVWFFIGHWANNIPFMFISLLDNNLS